MRLQIYLNGSKFTVGAACAWPTSPSPAQLKVNFRPLAAGVRESAGITFLLYG